MSSDTDQLLSITTSKFQVQLNELTKEMKGMAASIVMLVKVITLKDNATAQSGSDGITDP